MAKLIEADELVTALRSDRQASLLLHGRGLHQFHIIQDYDLDSKIGTGKARMLLVYFTVLRNIQSE